MPLRTMLLDAGGRTHHVYVVNPGEPVPDGEGGYTDSWLPADPPDWWCSIRAATAADVEKVVAGAAQATATHLIEGPFHRGISVATRITYRVDQTYEVQSVQNDEERDIKLTLVCSEVKSYGGAQRIIDRRTDGTAGSPAPPPAGIND